MLLCNIGVKSYGGDNLTNHPNREEIIEKITKASKFRYENMTIEEKQKLSNNIKGEKNPNYGNSWSEEMKKEASKRAKEYFKYNDHALKNKKLEDFYDEEKAKNIKKKISEHAKTRTGKKIHFMAKNTQIKLKKNYEIIG